MSISCSISVPIAGPARPGFFENRDSPRFAHKGECGVLVQPAREGLIVSSLETLLELPVKMQFIVLTLVQPDEDIR